MTRTNVHNIKQKKKQVNIYLKYNASKKKSPHKSISI